MKIKVKKGVTRLLCCESWHTLITYTILIIHTQDVTVFTYFTTNFLPRCTYMPDLSACTPYATR